uniref:Uncharacterized protein n=1 Tax=Suricata suricatta TaxID=37032 RepID=A0A673TMS8_SURSU
MRQDLTATPWPPGSVSEPSRSRDHKEQALLSCYSCCLTSLLCSRHLSLLAWVPTSLILGVRDPASGPRHPQGPPCHTVTALLRDQDKVLLLAPVFSHGTHPGKFRHPPGCAMLPLRPGEGLPAGSTWAGSAVFGS